MNEPLAPAAKKPLISLVAPCFNEAEVFAQLRRELVALAERLADRYDCEFVLVDAGYRFWRSATDAQRPHLEA